LVAGGGCSLPAALTAAQVSKLAVWFFVLEDEDGCVKNPFCKTGEWRGQEQYLAAYFDTWFVGEDADRAEWTDTPLNISHI